jgi:hypothetical protein
MDVVLVVEVDNGSLAWSALGTGSGSLVLASRSGGTLSENVCSQIQNFQ